MTCLDSPRATTPPDINDDFLLIMSEDCFSPLMYLSYYSRGRSTNANEFSSFPYLSAMFLLVLKQTTRKRTIIW